MKVESLQFYRAADLGALSAQWQCSGRCASYSTDSMKSSGAFMRECRCYRGGKYARIQIFFIFVNSVAQSETLHLDSDETASLWTRESKNF